MEQEPELGLTGQYQMSRLQKNMNCFRAVYQLCD